MQNNYETSTAEQYNYFKTQGKGEGITHHTNQTSHSVILQALKQTTSVQFLQEYELYSSLPHPNGWAANPVTYPIVTANHFLGSKLDRS
jgi:hypothetical protein